MRISCVPAPPADLCPPHSQTLQRRSRRGVGLQYRQNEVVTAYIVQVTHLGLWRSFAVAEEEEEEVEEKEEEEESISGIHLDSPCGPLSQQTPASVQRAVGTG